MAKIIWLGVIIWFLWSIFGSEIKVTIKNNIDADSAEEISQATGVVIENAEETLHILKLKLKAELEALKHPTATNHKIKTEPVKQPRNTTNQLVVEYANMPRTYVSNAWRHLDTTLTLPLPKGYVLKRHTDGKYWGCLNIEKKCYKVVEGK